MSRLRRVLYFTDECPIIVIIKHNRSFFIEKPGVLICRWFWTHDLSLWDPDGNIISAIFSTFEALRVLCRIYKSIFICCNYWVVESRTLV